MLVLILTSVASLVEGVDKNIEMDQFSFGGSEGYVNMTSKDLVIGDDLYSNEANIFIHNNATYDSLLFEITGKPDTSGRYLSDLTLDLGENGRTEYRFGGTGVGDWGHQVNFMDSEKTSAMTTARLTPTVEGEIAYLKLPSDAVVSSAEVNLTHPSGTVSKSSMIPSANNWGRGFMYYYNYYPYGYSYYYPSSNAGTYALYNYYTAPTDYSSGSGYPMDTGLLSWNINDPAFSVPPGANIMKYDLYWPIYQYRNSGSWPGVSGSYHHGQMTYSVYPVTSAWGSSYSSTSTVYYDTTQMYDDFKSINPKWSTTSVAEYTVPAYHGSSSSYYYNTNVYWDLSDLLEDWNDEVLENFGIMISMDKTPYCSSDPQWSGYTYYSNNANYYRYYYRGNMYSPGASTSYNSYKPRINIQYSLDSTSPWIDVGDNKQNEWAFSGIFSGYQKVTGLQSSINQYLRTHFPDEIDDFGNEFTYVPIRIGAQTAGEIIVSDVSVEYDYTAKVTYNPRSGNLLNELKSLVPEEEEGGFMLPIGIRSSSQGVLNIDNLHLSGEMPNYRPKTTEVPTIEVDEGIISDNILVVSDHFHDVDQDAKTLQYILQKNSEPDHVDLMLSVDEGGNTVLGIDTSKDENWYGDVKVRISGTDEFGKDGWTNEFIVRVNPVNDLPYLIKPISEISIQEGINPYLIEYTAPSGRNVALGKEVRTIGSGGEPYFGDIEEQRIYLDFELLRSDMIPVELVWENEDRYKIYRGPDNEAFLTVLPPEYTDDPDNFVLVFGSNPDFTTEEGPYYLRFYASDDPADLTSQTVVDIPITVSAVNDPPTISLIPDIVLDEDQTYVSPYVFLDEFVKDIDTDLSELKINFISSDQRVKVSLNRDGNLVVEPDINVNGVIPVTVQVDDGQQVASIEFYIRIRSINDAPMIRVENLFNGQVIDELYRIKGTADDVEKTLKNIEVASVKQGDVLYPDDWVLSEGGYVWQYLFDIRSLEDGYYTIYIRAFDGRDFSAVQEFTVMVVTPKPAKLSSPPEVVIDTGFSGQLSETIEVTGTVTDDSEFVSFVEYRIDGSIWRKAIMSSNTQWKLVIDTTRLTNEEHNLSVRAYDGKLYSDIAFKRFLVFNEDSDGDGISNEIETALLMDPFNKIDGAMDFDNDGFSNAQELRENTDPFDGDSHPSRPEDEEAIFDTWAIIFMAASIISAVIIIGLFVLNIRLERNMHQWRENLNQKRIARKPKTLLQKIVEIAPTFIGASSVPEGPTLPVGENIEREALPPMAEEK
ncbi:MAG: Ig-like domain-containing protein [Thermoplasmatota archaeon]